MYSTANSSVGVVCFMASMRPLSRHARPTAAHLPWFHHPALELVASRAEGPNLINRPSPNRIAFGCQSRHPGLVASTFHFGNRLPHTCLVGGSERSASTRRSITATEPVLGAR